MIPDEPIVGERQDRRAFVRSLIAGGALTTASQVAANAQDDPVQAEKQQKAAPDPLQVEVDARLAILVARRGEALDDEARETIRADIESMVKRARRLRRFVLDNGDGPFPVMIPYRGVTE